VEASSVDTTVKTESVSSSVTVTVEDNTSKPKIETKKESTATTNPLATSEKTPGDTSSSSSTNDHASISSSGSEDAKNQVIFFQSALEQNNESVKSASAVLALDVLEKLSNMSLTVEILKDTGIGRTINKLRKHADPKVSKQATKLVSKWKKDLL
jgi:hypothetical protein